MERGRSATSQPVARDEADCNKMHPPASAHKLQVARDEAVHVVRRVTSDGSEVELALATVSSCVPASRVTGGEV